MGLQPEFAAEPGFLPLGILAGGSIDEFFTGRTAEVPGQQAANLPHAYGFLTVFRGMSEGFNFVDGSILEHRMGAVSDAGVEVRATAVDHQAAQV